MLGIIVIVLGLGCAGIVYWTETRSANLSDDPSMIGYSRSQTRQMETMYGAAGGMTDDLLNALKRPGVHAAIIVAISTIVAAGCFYFSRPANDRDKVI
jgi:hypothetical protein